MTDEHGPVPHGEQAVPGEFRYWRDPEMDEWLALDPDTVPWSQIGTEAEWRACGVAAPAEEHGREAGQ